MPGPHHQHSDAKDLGDSLGIGAPINPPSDFSGGTRQRTTGFEMGEQCGGCVEKVFSVWSIFLSILFSSLSGEAFYVLGTSGLA